MNKNILGIITLSLSFLLISLILFNFENLYFLKNNIFSFDAIVFKDMAKSLFESDFKETVPSESKLFYHPHTSKLIYPLFSSIIHKYFDLELIFSMFYLNLFSTYGIIIILYLLINKFINNNFKTIFLIILFLIIWNAPLRVAFYNPTKCFAFDVFLISLFTYFSFILNEKNKFNLFVILFFLTLLSLQRFVVASLIVIIPILINNRSLFRIKNINFKNFLNFKVSFEDKIKLIILIIAFFIINFSAENVGSYSRIKFFVKFLYFHANPFEFIYTYYYAYGSFLLLFVYCLSFQEFRKYIKIEFEKLNIKQKELLIGLLFSSIFLSTVGGDDSDRMLIWFCIWHLLLFSFCINFVLKKKYYLIIIIFLITHLMGSRVSTQGIPVTIISNTFLNYNQQTTTDFNDSFFQGPKVLKKFRNELQKYSIITVPGIHIDNKEKNIDVYLRKGKLDDNNNINIYIHPYKYRINDIPFPLGYIHNQRNALIDHPWHGKWWVRFSLLLQWLFLQSFLMIYKKYKFGTFFD